MVKDLGPSIDTFINKAKPVFEKRLKALVSIPTISVDPEHQADIRRGASYAAELLLKARFTVDIVKTSGNPIVLGRHIQNASYPTVLLYNHLDVQPAQRDEWSTNPFQLTIKNGRYFGRGATDDKGPALTAFTAIEYAIATEVPLNFVVVWEFEEEIGSTHFEEFLRTHAKDLQIDSVIVSDTIWISSDKPAIPLGLRGMLLYELELRTANEDTHSGLVGGVARNPIGELAQIIAECYDPRTGRVNIPGFYDDIEPVSDIELDSFIASGFDVARFTKDHGLRSLRTTDQREVLSRIMAEPTFEVHGIVGGYTGPGVKTIVPAHATAKVSSRLVPNQKPEAVFQKIKAFITERHPDVLIKLDGMLEPYLSPIDGPYAKAAEKAVQAAFNTTPAFVREGGSIGAVVTMKRYLNAPIMLLGLSLPEHGYHAPNEHFDWRQASGGIKMFVHYFEAISKITA